MRVAGVSVTNARAVISTFMTLLHVTDDRPWVAATAGKPMATASAMRSRVAIRQPVARQRQNRIGSQCPARRRQDDRGAPAPTAPYADHASAQGRLSRALPPGNRLAFGYHLRSRPGRRAR